MSTPNVSVPHRRTRSDHASETAEDYVEAIAEIIDERSTCRVVDLATRFAVSHVTVSRIVARLVTLGLVETEPYQPVRLTEAGRKLAKRSKHRHDIVYKFLLALGVSPKTAAIDTEGIEHHVSPETLKRFEEFTAQASAK
jgi:DtxR family manganese transport transcriptional regulator